MINWHWGVVVMSIIKTPQYDIVGPVESFTAGVSRHHVLKPKEHKTVIICLLIIFEKN